MDKNTEKVIINELGSLGVSIEKLVSIAGKQQETQQEILKVMKEDNKETHSLLKKLIKSVEANEERFSAIETRLQKIEDKAA